MIGKIHKALTPYYDNKAEQRSFKIRPVLIIAQADSDDYVALPISSITYKVNQNLTYDIEVDPNIYPNLNLKKISYIRTHKQIIIHRSCLNGIISDMKYEYADLYLEVLEKRERFSNEITEQALCSKL